MVVTRALDFVWNFVSKFFREGLPIALAGAIATVLVAQYNRQPAPQPVIVQPLPPPPSAMQIMPQTVRDQYELVESLKAESEPKWDMDASQKKANSKELAAGTEERSGNAQKRLGRTRLKAAPERLPTSAWGVDVPRPPLPVPVPDVASENSVHLTRGQ
jgi:hypothetical protein